MSSSIDYIECPKCGGNAHREQDNRTCEVVYSCSDCDWAGEPVAKEDRIKPMAKKNKKKSLVFTCPECNGHELGSVEQVIVTYPISHIPANGDLDYDYDHKEDGDGEVLAYQCMNCGYELTDKKGNTITDCVNVPRWIKKNHKRKKLKGTKR
jgi:predicted RNA-binding Zn-ribbon protein involved in translation (DUF1610 family)